MHEIESLMAGWRLARANADWENALELLVRAREICTVPEFVPVLRSLEREAMEGRMRSLSWSQRIAAWWRSLRGSAPRGRWEYDPSALSKEERLGGRSS
jgi:hypothetical protein